MHLIRGHYNHAGQQIFFCLKKQSNKIAMEIKGGRVSITTTTTITQKSFFWPYVVVRKIQIVEKYFESKQQILVHFYHLN